jgi:hypothetical protein
VSTALRRALYALQCSAPSNEVKSAKRAPSIA